MIDFNLRGVYSFNTISPAILNDSYDNLKLVIIADVNLAANYADVMTINTMVRNDTNLPLQKIEDMTFLVFENLTTGEKTVLSRDWIIDDSVRLVTTRNLVVTINDVTDKDVAVFKSLLNTAGLTNAKLELV